MSNFEPGQIWTYRCRPGDESSRLTVLKVDSDLPSGCIVHISIQNLTLKCPELPKGVVDGVDHMPLTEAALRASVCDLTASGTKLPNFGQSYAKWRQAFDRGEAGAWPMTVAECLEDLEQSFMSK